MPNRARCQRTPRLILAAIAAGAALGPALPEPAAAGEWTVELEPVAMQVYGHDPHVLTVHRIDGDADPALEEEEAVLLEAGSDFAYRAEVRTERGRWGFGLDLLLFRTPQDAGVRSAAADGDVEAVVFEVADRSFISSGPGEVLFYDTLEDTTIETWTLDLYALRTLAEREGDTLRLLLGLRNADFDNDYRAVVGIEGVAGARLDASSNYDRMMGPLVGLVGRIERGRHSLEAHLGQAVVVGSVELSARSREFSGPFGETPAFVSDETFRATQDVAIPITDLRFEWAYRLTDRISVGAGLDTAAWWEVPVPPGLRPGGARLLAETTIVYAGLSASVAVTF